MSDASGWQFTLALAGADDLAVIEFTHREQLSAPFKLSVRFASRDGSLSATDILDREATLTIWQEGEVLRRVHGIVSEFARGDRGHRHTFYRVKIRPALWRLGLRHNSRIFQEVSPLTALNTLCDEHGLTDIAFAATREPEPREYLTQYRETDLAFVQRLAAEEGLFYFHEFFETGEETPNGAHRLVFADAPQVLTHLGERTYHGRAGGTPPSRHVRKLQQFARVARPPPRSRTTPSRTRPIHNYIRPNSTTTPRTGWRNTPNGPSLIKGTSTTTTPAATSATPPAKPLPAFASKRCARTPALPAPRATCPNSPPAYASR